LAYIQNNEKINNQCVTHTHLVYRAPSRSRKPLRLAYD